ncbi:MAG TPA: type II secretion system protein [Acidimicrobiales bacterium]|nr:type II secretion system protein [Acidimicrobiales bacterium]
MTTRRRRWGDESGFTLVELLMALLVLAIVMSASLYGLMAAMRTSNDSQQRVIAANLDQSTLESLEAAALSSTGFSAIPVGSTTLATQTVNNRKFKMTQNTEWVSQGTNSSACNTSSAQGLILRATITATWGVSAEAVSQTSLISPPSGTFNSADGSLGVQVSGASGAAYVGATVNLVPQVPTSGSTPAAPTAQVTGTDGCVFFTNLSPDSYAVTVSSSTGITNAETSTYNSLNQTANPQTFTVSASSVPGVATVVYDDYGTVNWSYAPAYSQWALATYPAASGMPISVYSQSLSFGVTNAYTYTPAPSSPATSGTVQAFPVTYPTIYTGSCTDADPYGTSTATGQPPFYPASTYSSIDTNLYSSSAVTSGVVTSSNAYVYPLALQLYSAQNSLLNAVQDATAAGSPPTAAEGQTNSGTANGVTCPTASTYSLSPMVKGVSNSSVGLGHYHIAISIASVGTGWADVSVMPDGVYWTNSIGQSGSYLYSSATISPVQLSL